MWPLKPEMYFSDVFRMRFCFKCPRPGCLPTETRGGCASRSSQRREQRQAATEPDVPRASRPGAPHAFGSLVQAPEPAALQGLFSNPARESETTEIPQQTQPCLSSASKDGVMRERNPLTTSPSSSSRARERPSSPSVAAPAPVPGGTALAAAPEHPSCPEPCSVKTNRGAGDVCGDPRRLVIQHLW